MTDQVAFYKNDRPLKSQGVKMQHMKMLDTEVESVKKLFTCSVFTTC